MAQNQAPEYYNKGDDVSPVLETTHVQPKGALEIGGSSGNGRASGHGESQYVVTGPNELMEEEAQSKGRWLSYVKTKQFWLVLLLGQGTSIFDSPISLHAC
jgi:hypothetical protein